MSRGNPTKHRADASGTALACTTGLSAGALTKAERRKARYTPDARARVPVLRQGPR